MSFHQSPCWRYGAVYVLIAMALYSSSMPRLWASNVEFNMDVLDVEDRKNIDLDQFSQVGHIMPGRYTLTVKVNQQALGDLPVTFYEDTESKTGSVACLSPEVVEQIGLTSTALKQLVWNQDGQCLVPSSLPGLAITGDLTTSSLLVNVPQAYLEYSSPDWDPPARWDNGLSALMFDYSINGSINAPKKGNEKTYTLSGNGVTGVNLGAWRFRGEWQGQSTKVTGPNSQSDLSMTWNRFYAYRALAALQAQLIVGEDYLNSAVFDSFRFIGATVRTDLNMMPPNLRGYAPEVVGTAKTNATVTVRQQGRVIYETQVAQGPFRIQDLSDALNGTLNVTVTEQDGSTQEFDVDTANLPFLTRPGQLQYKLAMGQPTDYQRRSQGENFASGEFSWGVSNGWSLFGGLLGSERYQAVSLGVGRDLLALGALSLDMTQSYARLPINDTLSGGSYRLSYSKNFEEYNSQVTFAGYRFSERDFMSMNDFLTAKQTGIHLGGSKELYSLSFSKNFVDNGLSMYLSYNHQTYWDRPENNYYNLMLSKYFDWGRVKNISASMSLNRQVNQGVNDDSAYVSVSFPWGAGSNIGYSMDARRGGVSNRASYFSTINDRTSYSVSAGENRQGASGSGFISYQGDTAYLSGNASYSANDYRAMGFSANGGVTLTPEGGALHRINQAGGTRLLVDTDSVAGVPIRGVGAPVISNVFGKAVIGDMNNYYRNNVQIDLNNLPSNVEAEQSVVQATLTEGAVGYRRFNVLSGEKMLTVIRLADGKFPPFGAQVKNARGQNTGIVADNGNTYLSGIVPNETMTVMWGNDTTCHVNFPKELGDIAQMTLLPCEVSPSESLTDTIKPAM
ncbi:outer membrane usher protein [Providencia sp. Je.9.19]|uniref:outer membrane usher protein n=1 Tax=Providencia sp. Je.9.19 TaxID=3142844 RepID=UPI003DA92B5A